MKADFLSVVCMDTKWLAVVKKYLKTTSHVYYYLGMQYRILFHDITAKV